MSKTRWLVAGAGMMGKIAPPIIQMVGGKVVGYLGITKEEASHSADIINLKPDFVGSFDNFDTAIGLSNVDAVYVATPNFMHAPMATKASGWYTLRKMC
jgi:predicted dehydrogenase